jgi:hypothetical protein
MRPARIAVPDPATIEQIKHSIDLRSFVAEYIPLRKQGATLIALCPFHSEKTGSFVVHEDYFKCFGCGAAGDVLTFVQKFDRMSFLEALRSLAEYTGIALQTVDRKTALRRQEFIRREAECVWHYWGALYLEFETRKKRAYAWVQVVAGTCLEDAFLTDLEENAKALCMIETASARNLLDIYREQVEAGHTVAVRCDDPLDRPGNFLRSIRTENYHGIHATC